MGNVFKKENGKYVKLRAFDDWSGFPADGVWLVKYRNGVEKSASCVSRLEDLPDPYPFYNMMLDRDKIATFLVREFEKPISFQEVADHLIDFLSQLNKPECLKIKFPEAPYTKSNIPDSTNINEFL